MKQETANALAQASDGLLKVEYDYRLPFGKSTSGVCGTLQDFLAAVLIVCENETNNLWDSADTEDEEFFRTFKKDIVNVKADSFGRSTIFY